MSLPVSRKAALAAGLNRYQTAKPCPRGHLAPRHVTKGCTQCQTDRKQRQHTARVLSGRWLDALAATVVTARETVDPKAPPAWFAATSHILDAQRLALVVAHVITRPRAEDQSPSALTVAQDIADVLGLRGSVDAQAIGAGFLGMAVDCGFALIREDASRLADVWPGQKRNAPNVVVLSPEAEKQRADIAASLAASDIPPRPWLEVPPVRIEITPNRDDIDTPPMPANADAITGALAAIQGTPWRVNRYMLAAIESMAAGLSFNATPFGREPKEPKDSPSTAEQEHARAIDVLEQARQFADAPELYFPVTFDWRGRMYQKGGRLQWTGGDDTARALLEFAPGYLLTPEGREALGVHLATLYGSKESLQDRWLWAQGNSDRFIATARDPGQSDHFAFWRAAKEPFQFLAACDAWRRAAEAQPVHLPIALDATASLLQHSALLLRDVELAGRVNLARWASTGIPPEDFYIDVSAGAGEDRATAKDAVVTFFYGEKEITLAQRLAEMRGKRYPLEGSPSRIRAATLHAVTRAQALRAAAMFDALRGVAGALTDDDRSIEWTTPDGFRVRQANRKVVSKDAELWLWPGPWRLRARRREVLDALDRRRQVSGIGANLIHSLDACLLRSIVLEAPEIGEWGVAHDCFFVHPNAGGIFREAMSRAIRGMYEPDVLGQLWAGWGVGESPSHGVTLPEEIGAGWYTFS